MMGTSVPLSRSMYATLRNGNTSTAGGSTWAARIPNRDSEPPVLNRAMEYAPIDPTTTAMATVTAATRTLRPTAAKMSDDNTSVQFAIVGVNPRMPGWLRSAGVLKLASATHTNGSATAATATANKRTRDASMSLNRFIARSPSRVGGTAG